MYHVPLVLECIYGRSDGVKNKDGKEGSETPGGRERVEITCPIVYR